ncbi:hypothetical protein QNH26_07110 [Peribacillus frigoritolerans]|uniref:hypothetical protein n=1 Tax=Peribacillus frigoritolerans TaxID=450367 RepID=UPI0024C1A3B4|nr:hypothetical protein [Peribacillus frigoritolerans]WHX68345.1 hypothetical protein QNH26_07110 [Peribacillus frigoritolerans]
MRRKKYQLQKIASNQNKILITHSNAAVDEILNLNLRRTGIIVKSQIIYDQERFAVHLGGAAT